MSFQQFTTQCIPECTRFWNLDKDMELQIVFTINLWLATLHLIVFKQNKRNITSNNSLFPVTYSAQQKLYYTLMCVFDDKFNLSCVTILKIYMWAAKDWARIINLGMNNNIMTVVLWNGGGGMKLKVHVNSSPVHKNLKDTPLMMTWYLFEFLNHSFVDHSRRSTYLTFH